MKKTIIFVLCSIFLFSAMACQTAEPNIEDMTTGQTAGQTAVQPNDQTTAGTHDDTVADTVEKQTEEETVADTVEKQTEEETVADTIEKETEEETVADTTEKETEKDTDNEDYCGFISYEDIEEFLRAQWNKQYGQSSDAGANSQNMQVAVLAPVLLSHDYKLTYMETEEPYGDSLILAYDRIDASPIDFDERIEVYIYWDTDWQEFLKERYGFDPENDEVRHWGNWFIGRGGYCCCVNMPESMYDEELERIPLEKVFEYFDFEVVSYSPSAETNAIQ